MDLSLFVAGVLVLAGVLALEFGISTAITELIAGVLLAVFVDVSDLGWLDFLAHFGMLGLMFMAGFEVDPAVARRTWRASVGIGLLSFAGPAVGLWALGRVVVGIEGPVAALVAIGLSTTSLALVYQFLHERDMIGSDRGQVILGAAMVVDVLSMVALALLLGDVGWATAIFLLAAVPAFVGLPRIGQWFFSRYEGGAAEFELRFLLLVLVGLGFVAEHVGIHAAVVGFLTGLVFSEVIQDHEALEDKLKGIVFSFFAPVFFLRAGTRLDLGGLDLHTLGLTAGLLVCAVGLKFVATDLAARWLAPWLGRSVGVLFNYRLTFGIIAATVGLQEGVIDQRLFTAILLVIMVSAMLPMILLRDLPSEIRPAGLVLAWPPRSRLRPPPTG